MRICARPARYRLPVPEALVPVQRWPRWLENFETSHGRGDFRVEAGALEGRAPDGSWFRASLPFSREYDGLPEPVSFAAAAVVPDAWGVLLVRKGGFAIARLSGTELVESKVGQRHVQGRTKAGGQSQQRFARRRDNQARAAYEAAADHALRVLGSARTVVTGGDRAAVDDVLADPRLDGLRVVGPWFAVPDPRRAVLDGVIVDAQSLRVEVVNA